MSVKIYRVLACPTCGRQYGITHEEQITVTCCGNPQPLEEVWPRNGDAIYHPAPEQFVEERSHVVVDIEKGNG